LSASGESGRAARRLAQLRAAWREHLDVFRLSLSRAEALPQLGLLGILTGLIVGLVMIAFRLLIETAQAAFLPGGNPENYEALGLGLRVALPLAGGLVIGLALQALPESARHVGVTHVLERLAYYQGRLPLRNALVQFFGGALSIICGHSVGREGPAVHLGAASGSLWGQRFGLPNNSLRVLAGCGVAAAIAASFNTPLAGVIFAMEVVLMEYTVVGFAPIILAAVSATALTRFEFGAEPAFVVPPLHLGMIWELPFVLGMGVVIGLIAAAFIALIRISAARSLHLPVWLRCALAGLIVGLCALAAPQVMGIGYDTANAALIGELAFGTLVLVLGLKLIATTAGIGLGLPGGLIGPALVMGACAGGALGLVGQWIVPDKTASAGFYALVGMGAMMGGALHAPLAALTAILELTANPNILWPDMLAVIAAYGVSRQLFRQESIFVTLMRARGLDYRNEPLSQSLRRIGVGAAMDTRLASLRRISTREQIADTLARNPHWILALEGERPVALLPAADLARQMSEAAEQAAQTGRTEQANQANIDLLEIPAARLQVAPIALQATLQEALESMDASGAEALYVTMRAANVPRIYGVLRRSDVERSYRYG
jgi:CIC family chloride channel protein